MSQNRTLQIDIIRDRYAKALANVKNFPGLDAELYSEQLREMADQLIKAADDLDALNSKQPKTIRLDELMARRERERGIKALPLEPELLLKRIAAGGRAGQYLADAFISAYRNQPFEHSLHDLIKLDAEGFRMFHQILHCRHVQGWSDGALYEIEQQIKAIINGLNNKAQKAKQSEEISK